jgi:predicted transcriptional regulator
MDLFGLTGWYGTHKHHFLFRLGKETSLVLKKRTASSRGDIANMRAKSSVPDITYFRVAPSLKAIGYAR